MNSLFQLPLMVLFLASHALVGLAQLPQEHFPVDAAMRTRVDFWKKVYTDVTSQESFLHDSEDLSVIYEKISYGDLSRRSIRKLVKDKKRAISNQLVSLAKKGKEGLTEEEQKLAALIGERTPAQLREMANNIRHQQGMSDRYLQGLERSFLYLERIKSIFREHGLPEALAYLPHVESSFNYQAYSKVGAAGIWQFMRATARVYNLKLNYVVDERRDPIASTKAAARFLRDNYARLQSWPLALTAYNHGPVSIERAVQKVGTRDLSVIIDQYRNRKFGFASKNFYATYVATAELSENPTEKFPQVNRPAPIEFTEIELKKPMTVRILSESLGVPKDTLQKYNPAFRAATFVSPIYLPAKTMVKVPPMEANRIADWENKVASLPASAPKPAAAGDHVVARGENLYTVAKLYGVSLSDLVEVNEMSSPSHLRVGATLKIPSTTQKPEAIRIAKQQSQDLTPSKVAEPVPNLAPEEAPSATLVADIPGARMGRDAEDSEEEELEQDFTNPVAGGIFSTFQKMVLVTPGNETSVAQNNLPSFDPSGYQFDILKAGENLQTITVESDETLGHFAEWAGIPTWQVRRANNLKFGRNIHYGQRLKIPISEDKVVDFNLKRLEYHQALEEDLFSTYRVEGTSDYRVRSGDTLDEITRKFEVPQWLVRKYQDSGASDLSVGRILKIPQLVAISSSAPAIPSDTEQEATEVGQ
jgi:membrane-bound lytic murein transglycosylase D